MKKQALISTAMTALARGAVAALVMACGGAGDGPGVGPTPPGQPSDPGGVNLTINRSINSPIPTQADSAWVRVYNPATNYSQAQQVVIPPVNGSAQLQFSVPPGSGYGIQVLAWKHYNTFVEVLAGGEATNLVVQSGQNTSAIINAAPWSYNWGGTDTLRYGTDATVSLQVTGGPTFLITGTSPQNYFWLVGQTTAMANPLSSTSGSQYTSTPAFTFAPPQVSSDSAMYVRVRFDTQGGAWAPPGQQSRIVYAQFTSPSLNEPLYRVPQQAVPGQVTVTF